MSPTTNTTTATTHNHIPIQASDLFDIEDWIITFCLAHRGLQTWQWEWCDASDMLEMSGRLCDGGVDIEEVDVMAYVLEREFCVEVGGLGVVVGRRLH